MVRLRGDVALNEGEGEPSDDVTGTATLRPASEKALPSSDGDDKRMEEKGRARREEE